MAIDKDKLLAAIDARSSSAYGDDTDSSIATKRADLIEYYLGLNRNPAPPGRSQVVDRSVFETVQTMLPSLVRIFASGDEVVKFTPVGPEDEPAADQTTKYINYVATQKNPWEQICADWIHDALVNPNAYAMAYWDETDQITRETYEGQTEEQLAILLEDGDVQVIQHDQYPDEEEDKARQQQFMQAQQQYQLIMVQAQQTGQMPPPPPQPPEPAFLHDVVLERTEKDGHVKICVLPPEHCLVDENTPDWTLNKSDYFEFRQEKTIAELQQMGLDVPLDISDEIDINSTPEDIARNRVGESKTFGQDDGDPGVMRKVVCRTAWVKCDAEDEDPRLYYVILVGRTILYAEQTSRIPVASMTAQPMPHRHPGMSVAETVTDIQDIKTAIKRGGLDNLYLANNGRYVISDKVNLDDFLDSRPGGVVRTMDGAMPGEGHVFPLTHPFAFDSIIGGLEYFDQDRQNRTGATRYFAGTDAGAINKTAAGTSMLQNAASMRVEHIARMMSPAFEVLFSVVHELVSKHQQKKDVVKLNGKWVNIDPTAWKTRRDVKISVGVGAGNKESMMQALMVQAQGQTQMLMGGVPVVKPENLYNTLMEVSKLQGYSNPDKYWTDPAKVPPAPPQPNPELLKLQADQQNAQMDGQIKMKELELDKYKADQGVVVEKYKADLDSQTTLQIEQMRLNGQAEMKGAELHNQAQLKRFEADHSREMEAGKARQAVALKKMDMAKLEDETASEVFDDMGNPKPNDTKMMMADAMNNLAAQLANFNKPKRRIPVRDKGGKITHVDEVPLG